MVEFGANVLILKGNSINVMHEIQADQLVTV